MQNAKQQFYNYIMCYQRVKHCSMSLSGKQPQAFDPFRDIAESPCTRTKSNNLSCSIEYDDDSFLSGSVNYSTEFSDDLCISDLSIPAEIEMLPYHFEPKVSDSESISHHGKVAMYIYKLIDLMFFVKSLQSSHSYFDV